MNFKLWKYAFWKALQEFFRLLKLKKKKKYLDEPKHLFNKPDWMSQNSSTATSKATRYSNFHLIAGQTDPDTNLAYLKNSYEVWRNLSAICGQQTKQVFPLLSINTNFLTLTINESDSFELGQLVQLQLQHPHLR
jgi:hypothetical protein